MADEKRATFMCMENLGTNSTRFHVEITIIWYNGTVTFMQFYEANSFNFHMHHTEPSYADLFHISLLLTVTVECE